jgi:hypothetical protein
MRVRGPPGCTAGMLPSFTRLLSVLTDMPVSALSSGNDRHAFMVVFLTFPRRKNCSTQGASYSTAQHSIVAPNGQQRSKKSTHVEPPQQFRHVDADHGERLVVVSEEFARGCLNPPSSGHRPTRTLVDKAHVDAIANLHPGHSIPPVLVAPALDLGHCFSHRVTLVKHVDAILHYREPQAGFEEKAGTSQKEGFVLRKATRDAPTLAGSLCSGQDPVVEYVTHTPQADTGPFGYFGKVHNKSMLPNQVNMSLTG